MPGKTTPAEPSHQLVASWTPMGAPIIGTVSQALDPRAAILSGHSPVLGPRLSAGSVDASRRPNRSPKTGPMKPCRPPKVACQKILKALHRRRLNP
jgi:hypothetical protein